MRLQLLGRRLRPDQLVQVRWQAQQACLVQLGQGIELLAIHAAGRDPMALFEQSFDQGEAYSIAGPCYPEPSRTTQCYALQLMEAGSALNAASARWRLLFRSTIGLM